MYLCFSFWHVIFRHSLPPRWTHSPSQNSPRLDPRIPNTASAHYWRTSELTWDGKWDEIGFATPKSLEVILYTKIYTKYFHVFPVSSYFETHQLSYIEGIVALIPGQHRIPPGCSRRGAGPREPPTPALVLNKNKWPAGNILPTWQPCLTWYLLESIYSYVSGVAPVMSQVWPPRNNGHQE